jgi:UDP-2-acetamido-2,6-beta-L-arabino-hexul-4-ose reductase
VDIKPGKRGRDYMKILVTGANGFIGKNLTAALRTDKELQIFECNRDTDQSLLEKNCREANMVYHLAGCNRPKEEGEYEQINVGFTKELLELLKEAGNFCPVVYTSSIQALLNNPYGRSKKAGEELVFNFARETGARVYLYRLPNVFGKWCRPNYNSVIATLCYNTQNDLPTRIDDSRHLMRLVYIDDLVHEMKDLIHRKDRDTGFCEVPQVYHVTLGRLVELIYAFKQEAETIDLSDEFTNKLYRTYISYLPISEISTQAKREGCRVI